MLLERSPPRSSHPVFGGRAGPQPQPPSRGSGVADRRGSGMDLARRTQSGNPTDGRRLPMPRRDGSAVAPRSGAMAGRGASRLSRCAALESRERASRRAREALARGTRRAAGARRQDRRHGAHGQTMLSGTVSRGFDRRSPVGRRHPLHPRARTRARRSPAGTTPPAPFRLSGRRPQQSGSRPRAPIPRPRLRRPRPAAPATPKPRRCRRSSAGLRQTRGSGPKTAGLPAAGGARPVGMKAGRARTREPAGRGGPQTGRAGGPEHGPAARGDTEAREDQKHRAPSQAVGSMSFMEGELRLARLNSSCAY
jgi:hypothetical protein